MSALPAPRLLPATIVAIVALLGVKSAGLVRAALPGSAEAVATAQAAPASHAPHTAATPAVAPPVVTPPDREPAPVSDAERKLLQTLRQRRQELDARDLAVTTRESVLAAAQQKLNARVDELLALQKKLEALEAARRQREELGWQGLVKVYEVMKPREAAAIFNDLQMSVLLPVLDRMKEAKAATILAAMNADKARDVTTALARLRTDRNTPAGAPGR